jgi:predicted transcriptional regulator of viral defense system
MKDVSERQKRLNSIMQSTKGMIHVDDVVKTLGVKKIHARQLLSGWHRQGILRRVAHGKYVVISPAALEQEQVLENPWVLVPELYSPGYVSGWSAAEHWGLTEQVFRSVCVFTGKRTPSGTKEFQGVDFFVRHVPSRLIFGTETIWHENIKIQISDPHKTVLDMLHCPDTGGGIQHVLDCFKGYAKLYKSQNDRAKLIEYALKINNGALFKKLGFFAEMAGFNSVFLASCKEHLTEGHAKLDSAAKEQKLITRWKLLVPKSWRTYD